MTGNGGHGRSDLLDRLERDTFDMVVVGGGITGAAIARRAAREGYSVALLERNDFGSGTTSASSKMLHGGLRYLEHGHLRLVREALHERGELVRSLGKTRVAVVPFLLPVYGGRWPEWRLRFGTWLYQHLSGELALGPRSVLSPAETLKVVPPLNPQGLSRGILYYEGVVDDALLTVHVVEEAVLAGAVAVNHVEVMRPTLTAGRITGLAYRDFLGGRTGEVKARGVVNAAGVWSRGWAGDWRTPELRPSKGVHLVFYRKRLPLDAAVVMDAGDGRWVFALPYGRLVVVGTTDTDFNGDPDTVRPEVEDVRYLLQVVNSTFPQARVRAHDIVDVFAGLRPLLRGSGNSTSDLSREYAIHRDPSGLFTVVGGKLTTHGAMAEKALEAWQHDHPLPPTARSLARGKEPPDEIPWPGSEIILSIWPPGSDGWRSDVEQIARRALARLNPATLGDVIDRRLHLLNKLDPDFEQALDELAVITGKALGWSAEREATEKRQYRERASWLTESVRLCREQEARAA